MCTDFFGFNMESLDVDFIFWFNRCAMAIYFIVGPIAIVMGSHKDNKKYNPEFSNYANILIAEILLITLSCFARLIELAYEFLKCGIVSSQTLCSLHIFCKSEDFIGLTKIFQSVDVFFLLFIPLIIFSFLLFIELRTSLAPTTFKP